MVIHIQNPPKSSGFHQTKDLNLTIFHNLYEMHTFLAHLVRAEYVTYQTHIFRWVEFARRGAGAKTMDFCLVYKKSTKPGYVCI